MDKDVMADISEKSINIARKYLPGMISGDVDKDDVLNADFLDQFQKDWLLKAFEQSSRNSFTWGLDCIDEKITTIKRGQAIPLVADENVGKTTFAYFFSRANKKRYGHKVFYYSLEQTKDELIDGIARQSAKVSKLDYRDNNYLNKPSYLKRKHELETQDDIEFIGKKVSEPTTLETITDQVRALDDIDMLIVDNLSCLAAGADDTNEDYQGKVIALHALAEELNIAIIYVHHYRKSDSRKAGAIFKGTSDIKGGGILKDLAPMIIQIARNPDENDASGLDEFYIREGKLRGGDKKEMVMVRHKEGGFVPDHVGF